MQSRDAEGTVAAVVRGQFAAEVAYKEGELEQIEDRISLAKMMLKRLRLGIMAQHYGVAGFAPLPLDYSEENVGVQPSWEAFEEGVLTSWGNSAEACEESSPSVVAETAASAQASSQDSSECGEVPPNGSSVTQDESQPESCDLSSMDMVVSEHLGYAVELEAQEPPECNQSFHLLSRNSLTKVLYSRRPEENPKVLPQADVSRFYTKKRIIVGNTSQYLDPTVRQSGEGSTHKWMVYVRGPSEEADISYFVRAVRFFLHPSYHPNDIVRITTPPFHLTRLGWGEFPVRVQLEFCDRRNKPSDIIHNLVLDRTHTGLQTLGAETVVDLDIVSERGQSSLLAKGPLRNGVCLTQTTMVGLDEEDSNGSMAVQEPVAGDTKLSELHDSLMDIVEQSQPDASTLLYMDTTPKHPLIIRNIFQPSSSPSDNILLDHDYCTSVVVSPAVGPTQQEDCTSSSAMKAENRTVVLTTNLDKSLHAAVRAIPLCGPPTEDFFLTAPSLAHFKGWGVGRRRAVEWMRAVAIKRYVQKRLRIFSLLSTKQVLIWCRRNGYTPLDPVVPNGPGFCKFCGCQLEEEEEDEEEEEGISEGNNLHEQCQALWLGRMMGEEEEEEEVEEEEEEGEEEGNKVTTNNVAGLFSTLLSPFQLFSDMVALQEQIEREEKACVENQQVDIMTVESSNRSRSGEEAGPRLRVPQTPELKWVQQTAAAIGIHIYPAVIDRMYAHVVEHMIFMACSRFLRAILTQAVQESGSTAEGELNRERILVPLHLYRAIQHLELCDILTNKYFGLPQPDAD